MLAEHQIEIEIKVPGRWWSSRRRLGIRFDMLAFFRMLEEFGIGLGDDVSQIGKVPFDEMITVAIFTGAESFCFANGIPKWFTKDQVLSWVDDSIITRAHLKIIGTLWGDFMKDYTETDKKKVKANR